MEHGSSKQAVPKCQHESLARIKEGGDLGYLGFYEVSGTKHTF